MSDRRITPANPKYAAIELKGQVEADHFVEGEICRISRPVVDLRCDVTGVGLDRQLLFGDRFRVLECFGEWAFGQADRGKYVGHVARSALGAWSAPNAIVQTRATLAFSEPDFKTPNPVHLSLGSRVDIVGTEGRFKRSREGFYIPLDHLRPLDRPEADPVAVAQRLLGTPYLWGGNSDRGIDCSGLVQVALMACGIECPGDSDLQMAALGENLPEGALPQRGDLLFWKGHVALVVDENRMIHANAGHMAVVYESISEGRARILAQGDGPLLAHKRL